jgi:hypothetical protein
MIAVLPLGQQPLEEVHGVPGRPLQAAAAVIFGTHPRRVQQSVKQPTHQHIVGGVVVQVYGGRFRSQKQQGNVIVEKFRCRLRTAVLLHYIKSNTIQQRDDMRECVRGTVKHDRWLKVEKV